jgi:hypothetical protein
MLPERNSAERTQLERVGEARSDACPGSGEKTVSIALLRAL